MSTKYVEVIEKDLVELLEAVDLMMVVVKAHEKGLYTQFSPVVDNFKRHLQNEIGGDGLGLALEIESVLNFMTEEK